MGKVQRCIGKFKAILMLLIFVGLFLPLKVAGADSALLNYKHQKQYLVRVPSMNAVEAFRQLSEQTSTEFLFPYDLAESRTTQAVVGRHTVLDALDIMLRNTGLASGLSEKGAITIFLSDSAFDSLEGRESMNSKKNILASTIAFFMGSGAAVVSAADQNQVEELNQRGIDEIIVTATKREQKLIDVPISISVLGKSNKRASHTRYNRLILCCAQPDHNQAGGRCTAYIVPKRGRKYRRDPQRWSESISTRRPLSLHPLHTGRHASDRPRASGSVLKGPQGTLYGQGSSGGTIRFITKKPSFEGYSWRDRRVGSMPRTKWMVIASREITAIANLPVGGRYLSPSGCRHLQRYRGLDRPT